MDKLLIQGRKGQGSCTSAMQTITRRQRGISENAGHVWSSSRACVKGMECMRSAVDAEEYSECRGIHWMQRSTLVAEEYRGRGV